MGKKFFCFLVIIFIVVFESQMIYSQSEDFEHSDQIVNEISKMFDSDSDPVILKYFEVSIAFFESNNDSLIEQTEGIPADLIKAIENGALKNKIILKIHSGKDFDKNAINKGFLFVDSDNWNVTLKVNNKMLNGCFGDLKAVSDKIDKSNLENKDELEKKLFQFLGENISFVFFAMINE